MKKDLEKISTDKNLIEKLYKNSHISYNTRNLLLDLLYPNDNLGLWISRILMIVGAALTLTGIIYFFSFNWVKLTPSTKFSLIKTAMYSCLVLANRNVNPNIQKIALLSASVFVGIFMAVFGQVYQTGANTYELFLSWSVLIFVWTFISQIAVQWLFWLIITNISLILWWLQSGYAGKMYWLIYTYLILFNGFFLALREFLVHKKYCEFLKPQWVREFIFAPVSLMMSIPIISWIVYWDKATVSCMTSGVVGLFGYAIIYYVYRYKLYDKMALSSIVLSSCIILDSFIYKLIDTFIKDRAMIMFLMTIITLIIFVSGIDYITTTIKRKEFKNA